MKKARSALPSVKGETCCDTTRRRDLFSMFGDITSSCFILLHELAVQSHPNLARNCPSLFMKDDLPLERLTPLRRRRPKFMQIPSNQPVNPPRSRRHQTRQVKLTAVRGREGAAIKRRTWKRARESVSTARRPSINDVRILLGILGPLAPLPSFVHIARKISVLQVC